MRRSVRTILLTGLILIGCKTRKEQAQTVYSHPIDSITVWQNDIPHATIEKPDPFIHYQQVYLEIKNMLDGYAPLNFKRAVFLTENAWLDNRVSYESYCNEIKRLVGLTELWMSANRGGLKYPFDDSLDVLKNWAIFTLMKDTIWLSSGIPLHTPFEYNFNDFFGRKDWANMFVTKLLVSHEGNCHSLPYLYKILADEIGASAYLAFAPNHVYIKHKNRQTGMYNTELTSGEFPLDSWITCSGYISTEAIVNEIYMDTLSKRESVAYMLVDLAQGFENKFGAGDGAFMLKCLDLCLLHFPNSIHALLQKAEVQKRQVINLMAAHGLTDPSQIRSVPPVAQTFADMEETYKTIVTMGYEDMPEQMYFNWLASLELARDQYSDKKAGNFFHK